MSITLVAVSIPGVVNHIAISQQSLKMKMIQFILSQLVLRVTFSMILSKLTKTLTKKGVN